MTNYYDNLSIIRPLGDIEKLFHLTGQVLDTLNGVQRVHTVTHLMSSEALLKACLNLFLIYEPLSCCVVKDTSGQFHFAKLTVENAQRLFKDRHFNEIESGKDWKEVVVNELSMSKNHYKNNEKVKIGDAEYEVETWLLWNVGRMAFEGGIELFLGYHHSLMDGAGQARITNSILKLCENPEATDLEYHSFPPCVESTVVDSPHQQPTPKNLAPLPQFAHIKQGVVQRAIADRKHILTYFPVEPQVVGQLLGLCKKNQTTLNALLSVICHIAMCRTIFRDEQYYAQIQSQPDVVFSVNSPISVRHMAKPPVSPDDLGVFIGRCVNYIPLNAINHENPSSSDVWSFAKWFKEEQMTACQKFSCIFRETEQFRQYLPFHLKQALDPRNMNRRNFLSFSNLGAVDRMLEKRFVDGTGPITIQDSSGLTSCHGSGDLFHAYCATFNGTMYFTLVSIAEVVTTEDLEFMSNQIRELVCELAQDKP